MRKKIFIYLCLSFLTVNVYSKVNFPFPQSSNFNSRGIVLSDRESANKELKSAFAYYLNNFYNEAGDVAGIRSNQGSNEYFSEGVGYGMLMMVYFSDQTTSYQNKFDKLWNFYQKFEDNNGLMNWKIGNLSTIWGDGAATDADVDVAAALILAYRQFGDVKYLNDAKNLIKNIRINEFEKTGLHKPGDNWNDKKNPSYVSPAYYSLFSTVDTDNSEFWNKTVKNSNYKLLKANSEEYSTGLFDNWTDASGKGLDKKYGYDAARAPWRLALAYYWYGQSDAENLLKKLGIWVSSKKASDMSGSIDRSGSMGSDHNSTFVATLMTSLVTQDANQSKLDEYWNEAINLGNENYFNESLKILCGLLVSGNMTLLEDINTSIDFDLIDEVEISVSNRCISIRNADLQIPFLVIDLSGRLISKGFTNQKNFDLIMPECGFYLVRIGNFTKKILVK